MPASPKAPPRSSRNRWAGLLPAGFQADSMAFVAETRSRAQKTIEVGEAGLGAKPDRMRGKRVDENQPDAVDYLRAAGYGVWVTSALGGGFPDLVVACGRFTALVEIKNPAKPKRDQRLTLPEQAFHNTWPGVVITAISGEDAWKQLEKLHETHKA